MMRSIKKERETKSFGGFTTCPGQILEKESIGTKKEN
jgi:hypothetical protein